MRTKKPDSKQPWHEIAGLTYAFASDLMAARALALNAADKSPLANAIRRAFPKSHHKQWNLIQRRYLEVFQVPPSEAVKAVRAGHSSPQAAMSAGVIPKRKRVGFKGERP